jgi:hypothetical protein
MLAVHNTAVVERRIVYIWLRGKPSELRENRTGYKILIFFLYYFCYKHFTPINTNSSTLVFPPYRGEGV